MSTLQSIRDAIEASRSSDDFKASEDPGKLVVSGSFSRAALDHWQIVEDSRPSWLRINCIDSSEDSVSPRDAQDGEQVRISLNFDNVSGTVCLFSQDGWKSFLLSEQGPYIVRTVRLAFADWNFKTRGFDVEPWVEDDIGQPAKIAKFEVGPRRIVRSQSASFMAPVSIEPWLLVNCEHESDLGFLIWKEVASDMLARSFPNELFCDGETQCVTLLGQPQRKLNFGHTTSRTSIPFEWMQLAAKWIYYDGSDNEVRHTFLSSELGRDWPTGASFSDGLSTKLSGALDAANLMYKAHLRSGIKDTLKALADLRKTLADDVQKLLQQAKDLSASVWRDIAVAVGVLAIRFALDGAKSAESSSAFGWIYILVAAYILISYLISVSTNLYFILILKNTQIAWRTKLYAFLDDGDYTALAQKPLTEALDAYSRTQRWTSLVVVLVVFGMVWAAVIEWYSLAQVANFTRNLADLLYCKIIHFF